MKKNYWKILCCLSALAPILSSCSLNPSDWLVRERDYSKLYVGGYPTISYEDSDLSDDYYLYITFRDSSVAFDADADFTSAEFNPEYDFGVDLNGGLLSDYGIATGLEFFEVSGYLAKYRPSYPSLGDYFTTAGNYIEVFSSVGALSLDDSHSVSRRCRIGASGQAVAFNTVASNGGELTYKVSYVYKESFDFGGE